MCRPLSLHIRQVINLFICETFVLSPQVLPHTKSESGNTGTPVFREIRFTEPCPKGTLNFVLSSVSMLYDIQHVYINHNSFKVEPVAMSACLFTARSMDLLVLVACCSSFRKLTLCTLEMVIKD